jgi:hypothetical protein
VQKLVFGVLVGQEASLEAREIGLDLTPPSY